MRKEKYPQVVFGVHVDDLSYSTESNIPQEVVEVLAVVHEEVEKAAKRAARAGMLKHGKGPCV